MQKSSNGLYLPEFGVYQPRQAPWGVPLTTALNYTNVAQYTDFGSGASLDTPPILTALAWLYPSDVTVGNQFVGVKFDSGTNGFYALAFGNYGAANGQLFMEVGRATQSMKCGSGGQVLFNNTWGFVGYQFNIGGVLADQKLFTGSLTSPITEVSGYDAANYRLGSGAQISDAGGNLLLDEFVPASGFANPIGRCAFLGFWLRALPVSEMRDIQQNLRPTRDCVGFWFPGMNKLGPVIDWSGRGNRGVTTSTPTYVQGPPIPTWNTL